MTDQLAYIIFNTQMGWVGILGSDEGIRRTTLPQSSAQAAHQLLGKSANYAELSPNLFRDLIERYQAYFTGDRIDFGDKLDLSIASTFQRQAWEMTRRIPYGDIKSYRWVAEQMGKSGASRAVGQALTKNPLPIIIPCHRVVNTNGKLGGFRGGLKMKRQLLHLETHAQ